MQKKTSSYRGKYPEEQINQEEYDRGSICLNTSDNSILNMEMENRVEDRRKERNTLMAAWQTTPNKKRG